ncbi:MAG: diphosphomevalonate decarboxylase, partial [Calditrichaeota bacterium]
EEEKEISSTRGMKLTAETSPYYSAWVQSSEDDLTAMRKALAEKDFEHVGELSEYSCLKMHGLAMAARPGIIYWNATTLELIQEVRHLRQQGIPAYFTIDAGPQVKILCQPESASKLVDQFLGFPGVQSVIHTTVGPSARVLSG